MSEHHDYYNSSIKTQIFTKTAFHNVWSQLRAFFVPEHVEMSVIYDMYRQSICLSKMGITNNSKYFVLLFEHIKGWCWKVLIIRLAN